MEILRFITHYGGHFILPAFFAWLFFRKNWQKVWLIMALTILVDLDHLFSYPNIFVENRCSIGSHPLHTVYAVIFYFLMLYFPKTRILATGLLLHILIDYQDCLWM